MAIGIIAFAFVALIGLLPAGLTTFRTAIDINNENRILQGIVGKVQLMDFSELANLDYAASGEIFYFDEEGTSTDTSLKEVEALVPQRIYGVKVFVEGASDREMDDPARMLNFSRNVIVVFANLNSPAAKDFTKIEMLPDLKELLTKKTEVRVRPVLVSKMDGARP